MQTLAYMQYPHTHETNPENKVKRGRKSAVQHQQIHVCMPNQLHMTWLKFCTLCVRATLITFNLHVTETLTDWDQKDSSSWQCMWDTHGMNMPLIILYMDLLIHSYKIKCICLNLANASWMQWHKQCPEKQTWCSFWKLCQDTLDQSRCDKNLNQ